LSLRITSPPKVSKKVSPYKYTWKLETDSSFTLRVAKDFLARVYAIKSVWRMAVKMNGKLYRGERATLEAASKAVDRMLYKNFAHAWTMTDARCIIAEWKGDLDCQ
jgi:hypothetical protein